ncbi:helix-turn-helix domain-containing protein [Weissella tructae]|uniref:helix-turn-helix domain-containing protein n=1 Tax=Weissella tructae TaxID=887702 RepID=UPI003D8E0275
MKLIDIINEWIAEAGITLSRLEKLSGLPPRTLYNLKYGIKQNSLNLTNATKIAIALDKDMNEFKKLIKNESENKND